MKTDLKATPREFKVGDLEIRDYGNITFAPWEMISVQLQLNKECDITATDWGFYLGSSTNGRMRKNGFRVAIVKNLQGKFFINAVLDDYIVEFKNYIKNQNSRVVQWLD